MGINNKCCAPGCKNTKKRCPHLRFHRIPKDRHELWVEALGNPDLVNLTPLQLYNKVVCSDHIPSGMYNSQRQTSLRFNAVPAVQQTDAIVLDLDQTCVVDDPSASVETATPSGPPDVPDAVQLVEQIGDAVKGILSTSETGVNTSVADSAFSQSSSSSASTTHNLEHNYFADVDCAEGSSTPEPPPLCSDGPLAASTPRKKVIVRRGANRKKKLPAIPHLSKKNRTPMEDYLLKCAIAYKMEAQQQRGNYLKKSDELRRVKLHREKEAVEFLKDKVNPRFYKFLEAEVQNYRRKPQNRRYSKDLLADFESMRQRGPRSFRGLPFTKPTRKTMKGVLKKVQLQPGINAGIFEMLGNKAAAMSPEERVCFVVFDEMSMRVALAYLLQDDDIRGFCDIGSLGRRPDLAEEVLVAMIRSVYGTWKHPVVFWYTTKKQTSQEFAHLFNETISALLDCGLDCRAMVTDGLQKNIAAQHLLGASYECPWFYVNGKKIVTICDPPHLMKSMRNAVLKYLIHLADGTMVDVGFIKAFLIQDVEQFPRLAPKVTQRHANPNNFEKMNVGMAVRLFSPAVSSGMHTHIMRGSLPPEAAATAKFSENLFKFFQSFQGILYNEAPESTDLGCALTDNSGHIEFWIKMVNEMEDWDFLGGDRIQVIRNWRSTVIAFLELWDGLKKSGFLYLPVGHVNQDCEENFFSGMRFNGGHRFRPSAQDIPSAFLRSFVKFLTTESKGKNCRDDEAVNLFDLEELIDILERSAPTPTAPTHLDDEEDEEYLEEIDSGGDADWLGSIASAKVAAPIVSRELAKLQCGECSGILVTQPQFPLHLPHTMSAAPGEMDVMLPNHQVATLVNKIYKMVLGMQRTLWSLPKFHVVDTIHRRVQSIPEVKNFELCDIHNEEAKSSLIKSFCRKALEDLLAKINQEYKARHSRNKPAPEVEEDCDDPNIPGPSAAPQQCRKLQCVAHL
ncbi:hypothetical protein FOCC_FOCC012664 [Frankliniella occidentalis]|nr:hypothetical protein FOCC_FOCC012664 [Frankliniella occidentalis]